MNKKETDDEQVKEKRLNLVSTWREVCRKQKGLMAAMIMLTVLSGILLIIALATLHPQNTVVIVGYGDVYGELAGLSGGYRRDSWLNMLAFPVLAVLFGTVHNFIALRAYRKYDKETALMIVIATMCLIVGELVVMLRLLGEW